MIYAGFTARILEAKSNSTDNFTCEGTAFRRPVLKGLSIEPPYEKTPPVYNRNG